MNKDILGNEVAIGDFVAWAVRVGNVAGMSSGVVSDLKDGSFKVWRDEEAGKMSNWIQFKSLYSQRVVDLTAWTR